MFNKKKSTENENQPVKKVFFTSQVPTKSLKRNDESTEEKITVDERFVAVADTSLTGEGTPIVLHAKLTMDEYKQLLGDDFKLASTPENSGLVEPQVSEETENSSAGKKIQKISITQGQVPPLANPAALKAQKVKQVVANVVTDDDDQQLLAIPSQKVQFLINGKATNASTLKQMLPNGEMNVFKLDGTSINIEPAKDFSGETSPVKLVVTTVNGDQHAVKYVATVIKPVISYQMADQTANLTIQAGDRTLTFAEAGVEQAFFTKDGSETTVVNMTANGQTVAEAQIEPTTGKIKLIPLSTYNGQLDTTAVSVYLHGNQKLTVQYQPSINNED